MFAIPFKRNVGDQFSFPSTTAEKFKFHLIKIKWFQESS